jgi:hypothetical protein
VATPVETSAFVVAAERHGWVCELSQDSSSKKLDLVVETHAPVLKACGFFVCANEA